jgi:hypothetical protein
MSKKKLNKRHILVYEKKKEDYISYSCRCKKIIEKYQVRVYYFLINLIVQVEKYEK